MMTRKCYACIKTAKESMREIQSLARSPANTGRILNIATRFMSDFGDVDPDWKPGDPVPEKPAQAKAEPAAPAPAAAKKHKPALARSYAADPMNGKPLF